MNTTNSRGFPGRPMLRHAVALRSVVDGGSGSRVSR